MQRRVVLVVSVVVSACAAEADPAPDAGAVVLAYAPCDPQVRAGGFTIVADADATTVGGAIYEDVLPTSIPEVVAELGDCAVLRAPQPTCAPACGDGELCNENGHCIPMFETVDVGAVSIDGLSASVALARDLSSGDYELSNAVPALSIPSHASVELAAAGIAGDHAFTLRGWGVAPIEDASVDGELRGDRDLLVAWSPHEDDGPARMRLVVTLDGAVPYLRCEVADTGTFTIPATLVATLIDGSAAGFATLQLGRASADSTAIRAGCVDLVVEARAVQNLQVSAAGRAD